MGAEAFPMTEAQRDAVVRQQRRRKILHTMAAKDSPAHGARLARALLASNAAHDSPVDVARRTLQRAGYRPVYAAIVTGGPEGHWIVGSKLLTTAQMMKLAAS